MKKSAKRRTMGRRASKTAAEVDLHSRSIYCYLQRAGATSSIKRMARRRERHDAKRALES